MYASHQLLLNLEYLVKFNIFDHFFLKEGMQKRARRDRCSCRNNAVGSALERRGLGASFEGYYTFAEALDVALSEVKEHAQP